MKSQNHCHRGHPLSNVGAYPTTLTGGSALNYTLALEIGQPTVNISPLIARATDVQELCGQGTTLSIYI
ncbi:MAG: hypothetical protein IPJ20_14385 [Flammeovirgaceae bacterium]|nr:hypothetical protein [Flammeovirgaceae bacterium]